MISLKINGASVKFETTVFPDKTSQIWKIGRVLTDDDQSAEILWMWESEAEVFQVCQLAQLLRENSIKHLVVNAPYLPYGRQDKNVANDSCFALTTLVALLKSSGVENIRTFDAHSENVNIFSTWPRAFLDSILNHDVICFPDKGAFNRYKDIFLGTQTVYCEKVRDQLTGEITGLELVQGDIDLMRKDVLIVDDIADGGMTFIKVAEKLREKQPRKVDLAVSHGLFSKGTAILHKAGIRNIFTTNSLLRNPEGFKVC